MWVGWDPNPSPNPRPSPRPSPNPTETLTLSLPLAQVRVEKDESHPGKVMFRNVYERNKEKFPYSRFEVYDPSKKWDTYTTHGVETYGEGTSAALSQHGVLRTV